jgi:hypothetical protein
MRMCTGPVPRAHRKRSVLQWMQSMSAACCSDKYVTNLGARLLCMIVFYPAGTGKSTKRRITPQN